MKPVAVRVNRFTPRDDETADDSPQLEKVFTEVSHYLLAKWTSEVVQAYELKANDIFIVYHAIFKSMGHIVGNI